MIIRSLRLTDAEFWDEELDKLTGIFLGNDYPSEVIQRNIRAVKSRWQNGDYERTSSDSPAMRVTGLHTEQSDLTNSTRRTVAPSGFSYSSYLSLPKAHSSPHEYATTEEPSFSPPECFVYSVAHSISSAATKAVSSGVDYSNGGWLMAGKTKAKVYRFSYNQCFLSMRLLKCQNI
ncbi:unnamed protein product [Protopolystoma xenopodis]|uniref:Helix-turn-helix domain-containing protein n=1 Tax=Protopolystoma xenopodis TaxID=117903 RepID=A0A3S5BSU7_9PLAT|nr:unnamed protein product [Protopolystoma xenopodis]